MTMKVYDLSQKCLFKKTFSAVELQMPESRFDLSHETLPTLLQTLFQKEVIPLQFTPFSSDPTQQECLEDLQKAIAFLKIEHKELEKLICPITHGIFKDPVIDEHGHTFERTAIDEHLQANGTCPISREPIKLLTPNRVIREVIEDQQKQDPIPTFSLFKKQNQQLAEKNLETIKAYIEEGEYETALNSYKAVFQYSKNWKDYAGLPSLLEKMGEKEKAGLAYLYLAVYQMQDGKIDEALATLEQCKKVNPNWVQLLPLLLKFYRLTKKPLTQILMFVKEMEVIYKPQEVGDMYHQLVSFNPTYLQAYQSLAASAKNPHEKAHILLIGAYHAFNTRNQEQVRSFCQEALKAHPTPFFLNRLMELSLLNSYRVDDKSLLEMAQFFSEKNLHISAIKTYKMLVALRYVGQDYKEIICSYDKLKKSTKIVQWIMKWILTLIARKDWEFAEKVALSALGKLDQKIPILQQLEVIYTHWQTSRLEDILTQLGRTLLKNDQLDEAEKAYRKGWDQFHSYVHAIELAEILLTKKHNAESAKFYYYAFQIALINNQINVQFCIDKIRQADPKFESLNPLQKVLVVSQVRILELAQALEKSQKELLTTKQSFAASHEKLQKTLEEKDRKIAQLDQLYQLSQQAVKKLTEEMTQADKDKQTAPISLRNWTQVLAEDVNKALSPSTERRVVSQAQETTNSLSAALRKAEQEELRQRQPVEEKKLQRISSPIMQPQPRPQLLLPPGAIGQQKWGQLIGKVDLDPALPPDINEILESNCPYWPSQKVKETHLLFLMPTVLNGISFDVPNFPIIWKSFDNSTIAINEKLLRHSAYSKPHWMLITKKIIPNSKNKDCDSQSKLLKTNLGYQLPSCFEIATYCLIGLKLCNYDDYDFHNLDVRGSDSVFDPPYAYYESHVRLSRSGSINIAWHNHSPESSKGILAVRHLWPSA